MSKLYIFKNKLKRHLHRNETLASRINLRILFTLSKNSKLGLPFNQFSRETPGDKDALFVSIANNMFISSVLLFPGNEDKNQNTYNIINEDPPIFYDEWTPNFGELLLLGW